MKKILFITNDIIGETAAGPGIRYVELGKAIAAREYPVRVMGRNPRFTHSQSFSHVSLTWFNLVKYLRQSDAVVIRGGGPITTLLVLLFGHGKDIIADLYAFTQFEVPHILSKNRREFFLNEVRKAFHFHKLRLYSRYIKKFWVANERQQNFLHGVFYAEDRLETKNITVIPFGYPQTKPDRGRPVLRRGVKGIEEDDFILIWGGGVWDWLDPLTLIKAMARVKPHCDKIKLYFLGVQAPSGYLPENARRLMETCRDLGLLNKNVFIHNGWVPYAARTDYLMDADAGVSLHPQSLETHYSFRTRTLDYIYCGLPMIHTEGDVWAKTIEKNKLGIIVPVQDESAVAEAILRLHSDAKLLAQMKSNINRNFAEFTWENISLHAVQSIERENHGASPSFTRRILDLVAGYLMFAVQSLFVLLKTFFYIPLSDKGDRVNASGTCR